MHFGYYLIFSLTNGQHCTPHCDCYFEDGIIQCQGINVIDFIVNDRIRVFTKKLFLESTEIWNWEFLHRLPMLEYIYIRKNEYLSCHDIKKFPRGITINTRLMCETTISDFLVTTTEKLLTIDAKEKMSSKPTGKKTSTISSSSLTSYITGTSYLMDSYVTNQNNFLGASEKTTKRLSMTEKKTSSIMSSKGILWDSILNPTLTVSIPSAVTVIPYNIEEEKTSFSVNEKKTSLSTENEKKTSPYTEEMKMFFLNGRKKYAKKVRGRGNFWDKNNLSH